MIRLRPITIGEAKRFIAQHHRHNDAPKSGLFAVGCERSGDRGQAESANASGRGNVRSNALGNGWHSQRLLDLVCLRSSSRQGVGI